MSRASDARVRQLAEHGHMSASLFIMCHLLPDVQHALLTSTSVIRWLIICYEPP